MIRVSSIDIASHCPGAPAQLAKVKRTAEQEAMLSRGSLAHLWIEAALSRGQAAADTEVPLPDDMGLELGAFFSWWSALGQVPERFEVELAHGDVVGHADAVRKEGTKGSVWDWKYGDGQRWILPPAQHHRQMLTYGAIYAETEGLESVAIHLVHVSDREQDIFVMLPEDIKRALAFADKVAASVDPEILTTGAHCDGCFARHGCPAHKEVAEVAEDALVPFAGLGGALDRPMTQAEATQWALARKAVETRVGALNDALRQFILSGGEVEDGGSKLTMTRFFRENCTDPRGALKALSLIIGDDAMLAASVSKGGIERALTVCGRKPRERGVILDELRANGILKKSDDETFVMRWKK
jgi:hypothetical protein